MDVKGLQDRLGQKGYYRGPSDGRDSQALQEALARALREGAYVPPQLYVGMDAPPVAKKGRVR